MCTIFYGRYRITESNGPVIYLLHRRRLLRNNQPQIQIFILIILTKLNTTTSLRFQAHWIPYSTTL